MELKGRKTKKWKGEKTKENYDEKRAEESRV